MQMASVEYETEYGTEDAVESLTPYMEFKLSWLEDNRLKIKGKSKGGYGAADQRMECIFALKRK